MYVPKHFREEDQNRLLQYIDDYSFGMLVVADDAGIEVNHVPFHLIRGGEDAVGYLQCHLARANPVWQRVQDGAQVLAVFHGPNAYISPSWYPTKLKASQNQTERNRDGVRRGLGDSDGTQVWPPCLDPYLLEITTQWIKRSAAREGGWFG